MTNVAKVHISLVDGVLQIEGSEAFVSEQISRLEPHIVKAFEGKGHDIEQQQKSSEQVAANPSDAKSLNSYEYLFALNGDKVQILKNIPGSNNSQKTVSIALLLGFAYRLLGTDSISSDVVRDVCKSHACYDQGNFASYLKKAKSLFLLEGGANTSKNIKLTVPGKQKAEELANQLNAS